MIKIGDRVKFLNAVGGGVVTGFSGKNIANVEDEQGFEVPTLISQLVLVDDGNDNEIKVREKEGDSGLIKTENSRVENFITGPDDKFGFFLAFIPENRANPVGGEMKAYLVNGSKFLLLYNYCHIQSGEYISKNSGKINSETKLFLDSFSSNELNNLPDFFFQLVFFREKSKNVEMPIFKRVKINPVKFYKEKSFVKSIYFSEKAYLISINNSDFEEELQNMTNQEMKKVIRKKQDTEVKNQLASKADLVEVDLHIHELLDDTRGLSNHEMLEIQMKIFREKLDEAIKNNTKRIVFIHGLGNGTLKQEIRRELSQKFKKYTFQDASFQEYGFGATMVILRR